MIVLLMGPPGSGKGTQAKRLATALQVPHMVMGELLRREVSDETDLGKQARAYMQAGELVPDELIADLLKNWMERHKETDGFIIDGFPRNRNQAELLEGVLRSHGSSVSKVIHLEVSDDELIRRLSERRVCAQCDAIYHRLYDPPQREGRCDRCGGELQQREDDKEEVILKRLAVYRDETEPLLRFYTDGRLASLNGERSIEEIFERIRALIGNDHSEIGQ